MKRLHLRPMPYYVHRRAWHCRPACGPQKQPGAVRLPSRAPRRRDEWCLAAICRRSQGCIVARQMGRRDKQRGAMERRHGGCRSKPSAMRHPMRHPQQPLRHVPQTRTKTHLTHPHTHTHTRSASPSISDTRTRIAPDDLHGDADPAKHQPHVRFPKLQLLLLCSRSLFLAAGLPHAPTRPVHHVRPSGQSQRPTCPYPSCTGFAVLRKVCFRPHGRST
jgi:hypothetical protein